MEDNDNISSSKNENRLEIGEGNYIIPKTQENLDYLLSESNTSKCFGDDYRNNTNESCCCVDITSFGTSPFPGVPPGMSGIKKEYSVFEATKYFFRIRAYKDGVLAYQSYPFLTEPFSPDINCGYSGFTLVLGSVFNECPGYVTVTYSRYYRINGNDYLCDSDSYSVYWNGDPNICDNE